MINNYEETKRDFNGGSKLGRDGFMARWLWLYYIDNGAFYFIYDGEQCLSTSNYKKDSRAVFIEKMLRQRLYDASY